MVRKTVVSPDAVRRALGDLYQPATKTAGGQVDPWSHVRRAETGRQVLPSGSPHAGRQLVWSVADNAYRYMEAADVALAAKPSTASLRSAAELARMRLERISPVKPWASGPMGWANLSYSPFSPADGLMHAAGHDLREFVDWAHEDSLGADGTVRGVMAAAQAWRNYLALAMRYLGPTGSVEARNVALRRLDADYRRLRDRAVGLEDYRELMYMADWGELLATDNHWSVLEYGRSQYWRHQMYDVAQAFSSTREREEAHVQVLFGDFVQAMEAQSFRAAQMIAKMTQNWGGRETEVSYRATTAHVVLSGMARAYQAQAYWGPQAAHEQIQLIEAWLANDSERLNAITALRMYRDMMSEQRQGFHYAGLSLVSEVLDKWERVYHHSARGAVGHEAVVGSQWTDALRRDEGPQAAFEHSVRVLAAIESERDLHGSRRFAQTVDPLAQLVATGRALAHRRVLHPGHQYRGAFVVGMNHVSFAEGDRRFLMREVAQPMIEVAQAFSSGAVADLAGLERALDRATDLERHPQFPAGAHGEVMRQFIDGALLVGGDVVREARRIGMLKDEG